MARKADHPLYSVWRSMKSRCSPNRPRHSQHYFNRGITVCNEWKSSFEQFLSDMGPRPDGYTLDRIDNDKGYYPENCRWADWTTQLRNQRVTRKVVIDDVEYLAADLADISGHKTDTIVERAAAGLSYWEVISPKRRVFTPGLAFGGKASGLRQSAKTHCPHGHEYTADNLVSSKRGFRKCKTCHRIREGQRRRATSGLPRG